MIVNILIIYYSYGKVLFYSKNIYFTLRNLIKINNLTYNGFIVISYKIKTFIKKLMY